MRKLIDEYKRGKKYKKYKRYKDAYASFRNDDYRIVNVGKKQYRIPDYICGYKQTYKFLELREKKEKEENEM